MSDGVVFKGGLPYGPDVRLLSEEFPVAELKEGLIIPHERIEKAVRQKRGTSRYYGVVNSWIHKQKDEQGIFIVWEQQQGLRVLDPASLLAHAERKTREKVTGLVRAVRIFGWVDRNRLDETGQRRLDHQARVASVIREAVESGKKQLAVELSPIKSLPKLRLKEPSLPNA